MLEAHSFERAPFRTLSEGPMAALLECRQLRPGIDLARVVIPGRQAKVTACVLNPLVPDIIC